MDFVTAATAQLSGLYIYSCALHPATHSIVYCVGVPGRSASHTYQVLSRCYKCGLYIHHYWLCE